MWSHGHLTLALPPLGKLSTVRLPTPPCSGHSGEGHRPCVSWADSSQDGSARSGQRRFTVDEGPGAVVFMKERTGQLRGQEGHGSEGLGGRNRDCSDFRKLVIKSGGFTVNGV